MRGLNAVMDINSSALWHMVDYFVMLVQVMVNCEILTSFGFYTRRNNQGLRLDDQIDDVG